MKATNLTAAPVVTAPASNPSIPEPAEAGAGAETSTGTGADAREPVELARPESRSASPGAEAYRDTDRRTDLPLTLSQLSPAKPKPADLPAPARPRHASGSRGTVRPPSPARPATKRPPSAAPAGAASSQNLKRSKTDHDAKETQSRASSSTSQHSQGGRARPGAQGASQSLASKPSHAHVRHPSADRAAKTKASASASASARERAAPGPSTSRSSANAEEDGKRAARGQLTGTRQLGAGALAASSSTSSTSSRSGDSDSTSVRDSHKENQPDGASTRRPASATGDHVPGHKSAMERSVSPTIHSSIHPSHRVWHPCEPVASTPFFEGCTLQARRPARVSRDRVSRTKRQGPNECSYNSLPRPASRPLPGF